MACYKTKFIFSFFTKMDKAGLGCTFAGYGTGGVGPSGTVIKNALHNIRLGFLVLAHSLLCELHECWWWLPHASDERFLAIDAGQMTLDEIQQQAERTHCSHPRHPWDFFCMVLL
jgi:hypothetical protein